MDILIKAKINQSDFEQFPKEIRDKILIEFIEPINYDYSKNPTWVNLKKESDKMYRELKKLEFEIRNP